MKQLKLFFIFVIACTLIACGSDSPSSSQLTVTDRSSAINPDDIEFTRHDDFKEPYSILLPKDWTSRSVEASPDDNENVKIIAAFIGKYKVGFADNIIIAKGDIPTDHSVLKGAPNLNIISKTTKTIGKFKTEIETGSYSLISTNESFNIGYMAITFQFLGTQYLFHYSAKFERFNTNIDIAKKMLSSLILGKIIEDVWNVSSEDSPLSIATDGDQYLIATCKEDEFKHSVTARLVSENGSVEKEIKIEKYIDLFKEKDCRSINPRVVYNDNHFILIYGKDNLDHNKKYKSSSISLVKISKEGDLIDNSPIHIAERQTRYNQPSHDIVFTGNKLLITWLDKHLDEDNYYINNINGRFIDSKYELEPSFILQTLPKSTLHDINLFLTTNSNNILVNWHGDKYQQTPISIQALMINLDGTPLYQEPANLPFLEGYEKYNIVEKYNDYSFIWTEKNKICRQMITESGLVDLTKNYNCMPIPDISYARLLSVSFVNDTYQVLYKSNNTIRSIKINSNFSEINHTDVEFPFGNYRHSDEFNASQKFLDNGSSIIMNTIDTGHIVAWIR